MKRVISKAAAIALVLGVGAITWAQAQPRDVPLPKDVVPFDRRSFSEVFTGRPRFYWGEKVTIAVRGMIEGNTDFWVTEECDWDFLVKIGCHDVQHIASHPRDQADVPLLLQLSRSAAILSPPAEPQIPTSADFSNAPEPYWIGQRSGADAVTFEFQIGAPLQGAATFAENSAKEMIQGYLVRGRISDRIGKGGGRLASNSCQGMRNGQCSNGQLTVEVVSVDVSGRLSAMESYLAAKSRDAGVLASNDFVDPLFVRDTASAQRAVKLLLGHADQFYPLNGSDLQRQGRLVLLNRMIALDAMNTDVRTSLVAYHIDVGDFAQAKVENGKTLKQVEAEYEALKTTYETDKSKRTELSLAAYRYGKALNQSAVISSKEFGQVVGDDVRKSIATYRRSFELLNIALQLTEGGRDAKIEKELGEAALSEARLLSLVRTPETLGEAARALDAARARFPRTKPGVIAAVDGAMQRAVLYGDVAVEEGATPLSFDERPLPVDAQEVVAVASGGRAAALRSGSSIVLWSPDVSLPEQVMIPQTLKLPARAVGFIGKAVVLNDGDDVLWLSTGQSTRRLAGRSAGQRRIVLDSFGMAILSIETQDSKVAVRHLLAASIPEAGDVPESAWIPIDVGTSTEAMRTGNVLFIGSRPGGTVGPRVILWDGTKAGPVAIKTVGPSKDDPSKLAFDAVDCQVGSEKTQRLGAPIRVIADGKEGKLLLAFGPSGVAVIRLESGKCDVQREVSAADLRTQSADFSTSDGVWPRPSAPSWMLFQTHGPTRKVVELAVDGDGPDKVSLKAWDTQRWMSADVGVWTESVRVDGKTADITLYSLEQAPETFALNDLVSGREVREVRPAVTARTDPRERLAVSQTRLLFGGKRLALYSPIRRAYRVTDAERDDPTSTHEVAASSPQTARLEILEVSSGARAFVLGLDRDGRVTELRQVDFVPDGSDSITTIPLAAVTVKSDDSKAPALSADGWNITRLAPQSLQSSRNTWVLYPRVVYVPKEGDEGFLYKVPVMTLSVKGTTAGELQIANPWAVVDVSTIPAGQNLQYVVAQSSTEELRLVRPGVGSTQSVVRSPEWDPQRSFAIYQSDDGLRWLLAQYVSGNAGAATGVHRLKVIGFTAGPEITALACEICGKEVTTVGAPSIARDASLNWLAVSSNVCTAVIPIVASADAATAQKMGAPAGWRLSLVPGTAVKIDRAADGKDAMIPGLWITPDQGRRQTENWRFTVGSFERFCAPSARQ